MVDFLKRSFAGAVVAVAVVSASMGAGTSITACAPSSPPGATAADARLDPTERAVQLRVALGELKETRPDLPALEVARAEAWLARAETLTRLSSSPELRDLLLDTAAGQVTLLRSEVRRGHVEADAGPHVGDASTRDAAPPSASAAPAPARGHAIEMSTRANDGGSP